MFFRPSKIKKLQLPISFLLIIVLFLTLGVTTIRGLFTLGSLTRTIYEHPLVVSNASLAAVINITRMQGSMKNVLLASSPEDVEVALKTVAENEYRVYQQLDIVREKILGKEGQILEGQTRELFVNWKPIREEVVQLVKADNRKAAILIAKEKGVGLIAKIETKTLELTTYARKKADNFLEIAEISQSRLENITIILTIAGILLSVIIAFIATYLVLKAEKVLQDEKNKLQTALDEIKTLRGIIPICSYCKQIRDDHGSWKQMEEYIHAHSEAEFSHSICPSCMKKHYPEQYESIYPDEKRGK